MDVLEFANKLYEADAQPVVERWADRIQDSVVTQTAFLVKQLDRMPVELGAEYWMVLGDVLKSSGKQHFVIPTEVKNSLLVSAPESLREVIATRFYCSA